MKNIIQASAVLIIGLFAIYGQTFSFDYLAADDFVYTTGCPFTREGISVSGITEAFKNLVWGGIWMPLTYISYATIISFFGNSAAPQHIINVLLHSVNTVLFLIFLNKLDGNGGKKIFICFVAAALWAWHPLRVESVAWIASRKDSLFTLFTILGLISWLEKKWITAGFMMLLSCMSKPTAVCFPILAFCIEIIKDKNFSISNLRKYTPLLLLSISVGLLATYSQTHANGIETPAYIGTFGWRIVNAIVSIGLYIYHFIIPQGLHYWYRPIYDGVPLNSTIGYFAFAIGGVLFAFGAWKLKKYRKIIFSLVLWIAASLGPTLGILASFGRQAYADRFTYVPMMALSIAIIYLDYNQKRFMKFLLLLPVLFLCVSMWYTSTFRDDLTVTARVLSCDPGNADAWRDYGGGILLRTKNPDAAIPYFQKAYQLDRTSGADNDLVFALFMRNKPGDMRHIEHLTEDVRMNPALDRHGIKLDVLSRLALRRKDYRSAVRYLEAMTKVEGFALAERARGLLSELKTSLDKQGIQYK